MTFVTSTTDDYLQWKAKGPRSPTKPTRNKIKLLYQCHIPKEIMEEKDIMVFVQETQHGQLNKMHWVILTQDFTKLHIANSVKKYGFNVGLDGFLDLNICSIDMAQIMEFLETMTDANTAIVTNHQGDKTQIIITPQLVNDALKLPNQGFILGTWLNQ